jgi:hypothetical protein
VQLPEPVIGFIFPAQRHMRRRRDEYIDERRRQARPAGSVEATDPAPDDGAVYQRARRIRDHRLAATESISRDQDHLLLAKASELERTGATQIVTPSGRVSARVTRFRWGDDVVEINRTRGGPQHGWSGGRLARSPRSARERTLAHYLAQALAALEPPDSSP